MIDGDAMDYAQLETRLKEERRYVAMLLAVTRENRRLVVENEYLKGVLSGRNDREYRQTDREDTAGES